MKILVISPFDPLVPSRGAERSIFESLKALVAAGHELVLARPGSTVEREVCSSLLGVELLALEPPGVSLASLPLRSRYASQLGLHPLGVALEESLSERATIPEPLPGDIDLVLSEGLWADPVSLAVAEELGVPLVVRKTLLEWEASFLADGRTSGFGYRLASVLGPWLRMRQLRIARSAGCVVTLSQKDEAKMSQLGVKRVRTVFPAYDIGPCREGGDRDVLVDMLKGRKGYIVAFMAHLDHPLYRDAARTFSAWARGMPNVTFVLTGHHGKTPPVKPRENLILTGFLEETVFYPLICRSDLIVSPIWWRTGLPIKLVLALALGKPVLTTSSALEAFGDARPGINLEVNDNLSQYPLIMGELLEDQGRLAALAKGALSYSRHFQPGVHAHAMGEVFRDAIQAH